MVDLGAYFEFQTHFSKSDLPLFFFVEKGDSGAKYVAQKQALLDKGSQSL